MKLPILAIAAIMSSAQLGKAYLTVIDQADGPCYTETTKGILYSTVPVTTVTYHDPDSTIIAGCGRKRSPEPTRYGYPPARPTTTTTTTHHAPTPTPTTAPAYLGTPGVDSLTTFWYSWVCTTTDTGTIPSTTVYITDSAWTSTVTQYTTTHLVFCGSTIY